MPAAEGVEDAGVVVLDWAWTCNGAPWLDLLLFAAGLEPGSAQVVASAGDERNALLMLTARLAAGGPFGTGTLPGARLYLLDENGKIKSEQVIFYAVPD